MGTLVLEVRDPATVQAISEAAWNLLREASMKVE